MNDVSPEHREPRGIESQIPLVMVLMVSSPFLLLAWLLVNTLRADLQHMDQVDHSLQVFDRGLAVMRPLETMRDLAPSAIFVDQAGLDPLLEEQRALVDERLPLLFDALHRSGDRSLSGMADRLELAWGTITLRTPTSNTLDPFDNLDRFQAQLDDVLSGTLYVSDLSVGEPVQISELRCGMPGIIWGFCAVCRCIPLCAVAISVPLTLSAWIRPCLGWNRKWRRWRASLWACSRKGRASKWAPPS